jgi:hypothetical protein
MSQRSNRQASALASRSSTAQRLASHFTPPSAALSLRVRGWVLHAARSYLILLFSFACAAAPIARRPTLTPPPPPTSASDNPTAGAARRLAQQAAATGTEDARRAVASQTAQAATETAVFQALTQQAVVAAATSQSILAAKAAWPSRVTETFSDNQMGWPVGLTQDQYLAVTSTVEGGRYHWVTAIASSGAYTNLVPAKGTVLGDFYAQVSMTFVQGNDDGQSAYGLVFRRVGEDFGFFGIMKTGSALAMEVHQSNVDQQFQGDASAIKTQPGAANRLAVAAIGPDFVFLVNDQVVGQMTADLAPGQIGAGVQALDVARQAQVDFSDFQVNAP